MPVMRPSESTRVASSRSTPPLSSNTTDRPEPRKSSAMVMPAAPAPAMHTSASSVAPSARVLASINMGPVGREFYIGPQRAEPR